MQLDGRVPIFYKRSSAAFYFGFPKSNRFWSSQVKDHIFRRNALLTLFVFGPLIVAFFTDVNFYPVPTWSLFSEPGELTAGRTHYTLSGQTADGTWLEIPPIRIVGGLHCRHHTFVSYTDDNLSLKIASPHPDNVRLVERYGGTDRLPRGVLMPRLLRTWGETYNRGLPIGSPARLTRIRLESRRWTGGVYDDYDNPDYVWEVEL